MSTLTIDNSTARENIVTAVSNVVNQIKDDPKNGRVIFKAASELHHGLRAKVNIRNFNFVSDEPVSLGGTDEGPNPVEIVLGAFAACQEIVIAAYAAVLDIDVKRVSVNVNGHLDLRGFFNVDDSVRPGFNEIEYVTTIETDETDETKKNQLVYFAQNKCPVLDILQQPIPVKGTVRFS